MSNQVVLTSYILARTTASLILKISHGYSVEDDGDPLVEMADRAMRNISETTAPGRFLADFFPICASLKFLRAILVA